MQYYNMTGVMTSDTTVYGSTPCIGSEKSINPTNDVGAFLPGILRLNAVELDEIVGICSSTTCKSREKQITDCWSGHQVASGEWAAYFNAIPAIPVPDTQTIDRSIVKAYAKLNSAGLDVGLMLAELRETLHGLKHPLAALVNYVKKQKFLKKNGKVNSSRKSLFDFLDASSGTWLEFRYGLLPLAADIDAIREEFSMKAIEKVATLRRKRGQVEKPAKWNSWPPVDSGAGSFSWKYEAKETFDRKVITTLYYQIDANFNQLVLLQKYGLSPSQLPSTLYELVTLSFVLDWFTNVGSWISALTPNPSIKYMGGCVSDKTIITREVKLSNAIYCNMGNRNFGTPIITGTSSVTRTHLSRSVNPKLPALPSFNPDVTSYKHAVDAVALIWQRLPKAWRT